MWARYIFIHEFGHHLAALADEYYTSRRRHLPATERVEPWEPNVTALLDPAALKWRDLVTPGTPLPTPWPKEEFERARRRRSAAAGSARRTDPNARWTRCSASKWPTTPRFLESTRRGHGRRFEGANYEARGFFRPEVDCIMFTRDEVPFCAVCRRAIERVLDLYTA